MVRALVSIVSIALVAAVAVACNSSSGGADGSTDGLFDTPSNACLAYGAGYQCQSGPTCSGGLQNIQDLDCGSTGQLCCGIVLLEGGYDAPPDVAVFAPDVHLPDVIASDVILDSPASDAKKPGDAAVDVTVHHDGAVEAGHDTGVDAVHHDAGVDASHHDAAPDVVHHDAASDAHSEAAADAKQG